MLANTILALALTVGVALVPTLTAARVRAQSTPAPARLAQPAPAATPAAITGAASVTIGGDVRAPVAVTIDELKKLPRTTVTMSEHGHDTHYEGVLVSELLARAGVPLGPALSGKALSTYILASASDGYQVVFSIGELDPALTHGEIIVADATDGAPLSTTQGPLRIVAPHDARGARSIRMLQRLDIVQVRK